jgi:WhiB family redox-sensing transcriptional regulator
MTARTDWQERGACRAGDPEAWFAANMTAATAQRLCTPCPVRAECLAWALDTGEPYGVWGGVTAAERRRIRRAQSKPVAAEATASTTSAARIDRADANTTPGKAA